MFSISDDYNITKNILGSSSQYGWPLRNIHISNDNVYLTFYVDCFFPLSLPRLLLGLTVPMSNMAGVVYEVETVYPSRVPEVIPVFFLFFCFVFFCFFFVFFFGGVRFRAAFKLFVLSYYAYLRS